MLEKYARFMGNAEVVFRKKKKNQRNYSRVLLIKTGKGQIEVNYVSGNNILVNMIKHWSQEKAKLK